MESNKSESPKDTNDVEIQTYDVFVHADEGTIGFYERPMGFVEVTDAPLHASYIKTGRIVDNLLSFDAETIEMRPTVRPALMPEPDSGILSFLQLSPSLAWSWLISSLPNFWNGRFRLTTELRQVLRKEAGQVELEKLFDKRIKQKHDLAQHARSLSSKAWALRYHRTNFREAISSSINEPSNRYFNIIRANAEFCAHDAACYSLLEELAGTLSLMMQISKGKESATSFHTLYKQRGKLDQKLEKILNAASWYEGFRSRRANTAHAFACLVNIEPETKKHRLLQHRDPRIIESPPNTAEVDQHALGMFNQFASDFDALLLLLADYMLGQFHPYDIVSAIQFPPDEKPSLQHRKTVWVRGLIFDPAKRVPEEGEAIANLELMKSVQSSHDGGLIIRDYSSE